MTFTAGDLTIDTEHDDGVLRLIWKGKSNARNPGQVLAPLFSSELERASNENRTLEMRFDQLEHFNSSTIAAVIQLIHQARAKTVRLSLVFDPSVKWQKLSFESLRVLSGPDGLLELKAKS